MIVEGAVYVYCIYRSLYTYINCTIIPTETDIAQSLLSGRSLPISQSDKSKPEIKSIGYI